MEIGEAYLIDYILDVRAVYLYNYIVYCTILFVIASNNAVWLVGSKV